MIVFSNTTPLIALAGINRLDLLQAIFGRIHLTQEVVDECAAGGKIFVPELTKLPWVEIVQSTHPTLPSLLLDLDLDRDEFDMAKKLRADRVIIDERIVSNLFEYIDLRVICALGVLLKVKQLGLNTQHFQMPLPPCWPMAFITTLYLSKS